MARHRRPLTRDDLLHRYASATGRTYGEAHDVHGDTDIEELRDIVDVYEAKRSDERPGRRRSFAASQRTTTVHGQTR